MRSDRRRDLLRILHEGNATSQQEIVDALRAGGHEVTQATVSRDLQELGAAKARVGGRLVYRLSDELPHSPGGDLVARNLTRTVADFVIDVAPAGTVAVLKTAPGHASAVARAVDLAAIPEVVGTIAGDDTIFVATPSPEAAAALCARWSSGRDAATEAYA